MLDNDNILDEVVEETKEENVFDAKTYIDEAVAKLSALFEEHTKSSNKKINDFVSNYLKNNNPSEKVVEEPKEEIIDKNSNKWDF